MQWVRGVLLLDAVFDGGGWDGEEGVEGCWAGFEAEAGGDVRMCKVGVSSVAAPELQLVAKRKN